MLNKFIDIRGKSWGIIVIRSRPAHYSFQFAPNKVKYRNGRIKKDLRRKSPVITTSTEPQYCSIDLRLKILGRLPFFAGLSRESLQAINPWFVEVGYQPGDRIYTSGDPAERLFVVAEGKIKLLQHAPNGRDVLLDILASGEFFGNPGILGAMEYSDTAQAQTPACVLSIPSESFHKILDAHPTLAVKALAVMT
jgi:hypothetical protein